MRVLYDRFGEKGRCAGRRHPNHRCRLTDLDLNAFFDEALHGTGDAPWERLTDLLHRAGIEATLRREGTKDRGGKAGKAKESEWAHRGDLGMPTAQWYQSSIRAQRRPRNACRRCTRDEIIAMNHIKAGADLPSRIAKLNPGKTWYFMSSDAMNCTH